MCIEVTCSASELSADGDLYALLDLVGKTFDEYLDLFTEPGGRSGLAMCTGQHRDISPFICQDLQLLVEVEHCREILKFHGLFQESGTAVLLMSWEVSPKCTHSDRCSAFSAFSFSLRKYSTAFTS